MDCDRSSGRECGVGPEELRELLKQTMEEETEMLRTYTILSERIHDNDALKARLQNFAEGNAKRSRQLMDELRTLE